MTIVAFAPACDGALDDDEARFGSAEQAFATPGTEVNVSDGFMLETQRDSFNPSIAWIRTPNAANGNPSRGHVLTAYTRKDQVASTAPIINTARWAVATTWSGSAHSEFRANEWIPAANSHRWPAPDNLCGYYPNAAECGGSVAWNQSSTFHWTEPAAALWTGLDRGAAIVTTGGGTSGSSEAVFVVASNDGGQSFQRSLIVSIEEGGPPTLPGDAGAVLSGGGIVPGSVHASLAWYAERTSHVAGQHALPIDIVWQNDPAIGDTEWWWTRVMVGEDAQIAQITPPKKLPSVVPRLPGVRVSIFGYRANDQERVGIAWSERGDANDPNGCTVAGTNIPIAWYAASTKDLGDTWGCFEGNEYGSPWAACSAGQTTIATSNNWPTCIRPDANFPIVNNDRPEVAINAPADHAGDGITEEDGLRYFYFAVTKNSSQTRAAACVYRTGSIFPLGSDYDTIVQLAGSCTPANDASGRPVVGSGAQALMVAQGTTYEPRVQMIYRNRVKTPATIRYDVMDIDYDAFASSTTTSVAHLSTADADFNAGIWGPYSGLTVYERCDPGSGFCPIDTAYTDLDDTTFAAAFTSTHRTNPPTPKVSDSWTRAFDWR